MQATHIHSKNSKIKLYIGVKDESEEKAINKMEELKEELSKIIK